VFKLLKNMNDEYVALNTQSFLNLKSLLVVELLMMISNPYLIEQIVCLVKQISNGIWCPFLRNKFTLIFWKCHTLWMPKLEACTFFYRTLVHGSYDLIY